MVRVLVLGIGFKLGIGYRTALPFDKQLIIDSQKKKHNRSTFLIDKPPKPATFRWMGLTWHYRVVPGSIVSKTSHEPLLNGGEKRTTDFHRPWPRHWHNVAFIEPRRAALRDILQNRKLFLSSDLAKLCKTMLKIAVGSTSLVRSYVKQTWRIDCTELPASAGSLCDV